MTKEDDEDVNIVVQSITFIGKEAYSLVKALALPEKPISPSYTALKDLLLDYVKYTNFECGKGGRFRKTIHEDIKNSTTLRHPNPVHTQVLMDADFSNDLLLCNDILNKCEETISEESNLDVLSNIICPHNAFGSCGKLIQCEAQVLNDLDFDYNSDDFISTAVYPYRKNTSNVYSSQCDKYVLN
ncbi:unnamed protein product [Schistosoma mattheei]|uniref:Uncharacterized protein n=1 Tax=Schistosoma mattheei TaxID=31246 RepID=A0A183PJR7_9TREM|nr:unnamed protein product [Schistosoma mattheei]